MESFFKQEKKLSQLSAPKVRLVVFLENRHATWDLLDRI